MMRDLKEAHAMTPEEWKATCDAVTDAMRTYTRPFIAPLVQSDEEVVRSVGTGSFIDFSDGRILLTCEHVRREGGEDFRFYGSDDVFKHPGPWVEEKRPAIDIAFAPVTPALWGATSHQAKGIPYDRFATKHMPGQKEEILFFHGFAGENSKYGFGIHEANASAYSSQQAEVAVSDRATFEMFWEPEAISFTTGTDDETRMRMKAENAGGFSGSLVWNTRYLETLTAGRDWSPDEAMVTGLLRRWDTSTKRLLVFRVEHCRAWLESKWTATAQAPRIV
jgi:hypothetical protein